MPLSTIILVVIVVVVALIVLNFIFESFRYIINIVVIIALAIWILYALGVVNNLPNMNHLFDKIGDAISKAGH